MEPKWTVLFDFLHDRYSDRPRTCRAHREVLEEVQRRVWSGLGERFEQRRHRPGNENKDKKQKTHNGASRTESVCVEFFYF